MEKAKIDKDNKKEMWLRFLKVENRKELEEMQELGDNMIKEAAKVVYNLSEDDLLRERARRREEAIFNEQFTLHAVREQGIKQGMDKMVEKMRKSGMTEEMINAVLSQNIDN